MNVELDNIDLQILGLMQDNARISNADIARELSMAPSAVLERVKKLENAKLIRGYYTEVNEEALGIGIRAIIQITLTRQIENAISNFKKEIDKAGDPAAELAKKEKEYGDLFANPYRAAERGFIDEVIFPEETRKKLIKAFKMLENKVANLPRKKHGNIPL